MNLGAYMIVKNEEAMLAACLSSLVGFDEITILDTGSTDRTAEVAAGFPCNYIAGKYVWEDSFCTARNESLKHATADWLLLIDADETLSPGGATELRLAVAANGEARVLRLPVVSSNGKCRHLSARVHRRQSEIFWKGDCHNYLSVFDGPALDAPIVTYGYSPAHQLDPDRALRILSRVCEEHPGAVRERFYLAREHYYRKQYAETLKQLELYQAVANWPPEMAEARLMAGRAAWAMKDWHRAWAEGLAAIRINADFAEAFRFLASLSGPKNKVHWTRIAARATNQDVMFVRPE